MTVTGLRKLLMGSLAVAALGGSAVGNAQAVITLTPTDNQRTVLAGLRPGDTLRFTGVFAAPVVLRNRDFMNVNVDATGAVFQSGFVLGNVHNLAINGGVFGRSDIDIRAWHTVQVVQSSNISLTNGLYLGNSDSRGAGLLVTQSNQITVSNSRFSGHGTGLGVRNATNVLVSRNTIVGSTGDGINVIDSQRVLVSQNSCSSFNPGPGAHPDCIQLWSLPGRPLQSDIAVLNNSAIGNMQAFVSFDPRTGSGNRLVFAGNYAAVTFTHGVSCTRCNDSIFMDNVLSNLPEARFGAPGLKLTEGTGNLVSNNLAFDVRGLGNTPGFELPSPIWSNYVPDWADSVGSQLGNDLGGAAIIDMGTSTNAVPEPASWLLLGLGFALIGGQLRLRAGERRQPRTVMA